MPIARLVLRWSAPARLPIWFAVRTPPANCGCFIHCCGSSRLSQLRSSPTRCTIVFSIWLRRGRGVRCNMLCKSRSQRHANVIGILGPGDALHGWTKTTARTHALSLGVGGAAVTADCSRYHPYSPAQRLSRLCADSHHHVAGSCPLPRGRTRGALSFTLEY